MARERVIVTLLCTSQSDAEQVHTNLQEKLAPKQLFAKYTTALHVELVRPTTWGVVVSVSFMDRLNAVDIRDTVVNRWTSGSLRNKILAGSEVSVHTCSHDDGEPPPHQNCRERNFELRRK